MKFSESLMDFTTTSTKRKIIKFLLAHHAQMSEREMAAVLKVSHMTINRFLRELSAVNFVNFVTVGKAHLWQVNHQSYAFKFLSKTVGNIPKIKEPLEDLRIIILKHIPSRLVKKIILFGSIAKKLEKPNSDIDLFILTPDLKSKENIEPFINKLSVDCLNAYGNRLSPYILTEKEANQRKHLKIIAETNNGIQLFP